MRLRVQLCHEVADRRLVEIFEVAGPVVLIAQAPQDDRRMVVVLVNHVTQHLAALLFVNFTAQPTSTPRDFFPCENPQLVAQLQHQRCLLVMAEPHEVHAHILHRLQCLPHDPVRHGGSDSRVVFMVMRATQQ